MATNTTNPAATPAAPVTSSNFMQYLQAATGAGSQNTSPMFNPTTTNTTYLTQTSQPDIASMVNATMQSLLGRFATPEEIQKYGSELLAAERANTGSYSGETTYKNTGATPNRRNTVTGTQISAGVDPQAFIANLIQGTGEARTYKAATQYFDVMKQSNDKFRSAFSG